MALFALTANGAAITAAIADRLLSLEAVDELGETADSLTITLDDRDALLEMPRTGALLALTLGPLGASVQIGTFAVDTVTVEAPPRILSITARAADMTGPIRATRSQAWSGATLGTISAEIATRHGLTLRIAPDLAAQTYVQVEQASESDLHLMTRLARGLHAVAKVAEGKLIIAPRGAIAAISGAALPAASIIAADLSHWSWQGEARTSYGAVRARWGDRGAAKLTDVVEGSGPGPTYEIRRRYATEAEARTAASRQRAALSQAGGTLTLACAGFRGDVAAGSPLAVSGLRAGVDGLWSASRVTHRLDGAGLLTVIEATSPDGAAE